MLLDLTDTKKLVGILQMGHKAFHQILEVLQTFQRGTEGGGRLCLALRCMMLDNYYRTADQEYHAELLITAFVLYSLATAFQQPTPLPNTKSVLFLMLQQLEGEIRERRGNKDDADALRQKTALKVFILQCISSNLQEDVMRKTPHQILQTEVAQLQAEHARLQLQCKSQLVQGLDEARRAYEQEQALSAGGFLSRGVTPLLVLPDPHGRSDADGWRQTGLDAKPALDLRFDPLCDRPRPPPLSVGEDELVWLYTQGLPTDLIWDETMGSTADSVLELRERVQKAHATKLTSEEDAALTQRFKQNAQSLLRVGISPQRLPELVEKNPKVVAFVLTQLCRENFAAAEEFLTALVYMDPCLPVCEVLLELLLPASGLDMLGPGGKGARFTSDFVCHAIAAATSPACLRGRAVQSKKLIGVFCLQLLRQESRAALFDPIRDELRQFCVENSKIIEVTNLYKELQKEAS